MEIMDAHTTALVEAWLRVGLPLDADAVLLIEVDGPPVSLPPQVERNALLARANGARSTRVARGGRGALLARAQVGVRRLRAVQTAGVKAPTRSRQQRRTSQLLPLGDPHEERSGLQPHHQT